MSWLIRNCMTKQGIGLGLGVLCYAALFMASNSRSVDRIAPSKGYRVALPSSSLTLVADPPKRSRTTDSYVVLGYNDLGMHCMNQDFSRICILPPYNTLHAQVIKRGREEPEIVTKGVTVQYSIPGNTTSTTKTNFWMYAPKLFGVTLKPNIGLTGNGLTGTMVPTGSNDWAATGIPVTPLMDTMQLNPYPLAEIKVVASGKPVATTHAVVPVSWEISCNLCHAPNGTGANVENDILAKHDAIHKTSLLASANSGSPVLCAKCHADVALGTTGVAGVKSMSHAMHASHAPRMKSLVGMTNTCYACHPGNQTNCQRDIHFSKGIHCTQCHGGMEVVGNTARQPWLNEPTCGSCHKSRRPDFDFEEPGKLFKESRGHHGVHCAACHGSPHAIGPTVNPEDNVQAIEKQGFAGTIRKCTVCHTTQPNEKFVHKLDD